MVLELLGAVLVLLIFNIMDIRLRLLVVTHRVELDHFVFVLVVRAEDEAAAG